MEMLLVNPRSRKRRKKVSRKMSALQRKYFGKRKKSRRRSKSRASNPVRRRRRNPRKRSRARRARSHRRYRRNPLPNIRRTFSIGNVKGQVMGAIPGAFGALALDVAMGILPIPISWKMGNIAYVTKIAGAIALGAVAGMVVPQRIANEMTQGALTVMFHGLLKNLTAQFAPGLTLGAYLGPSAYPGGSIPGVAGLGYYGAGMSPRGALPRSSGGVGAYLPTFTSEVFDEVYGDSGGNDSGSY